MPSKGQKMGINDSVLWRQEWMRQFHSIKTALHGLRLQTEQRRNGKATAKSIREMEHWFGLVDEAFAVLNTPEPETEADYGMVLGPKGRREFLSDLKHGGGEVRT